MNFELLKLLVKDFEIILDELILNIFIGAYIIMLTWKSINLLLRDDQEVRLALK